MELRHLRYFVAVAEAEHFGKAAERLHVSQSPLSRQIASLEEEVGAALFLPAGRGVKLSPAGKNFLEGARATLARAALAVEDARASAEGRVGTIRIGFEGGLAYTGRLPKIVEAFRARHPRVAVRLLSLDSDAQIAALHEGAITLGYGYHPPDDARIHHRVLFRDRFGVVLPRTHRLAGRRTLGLADLKDERFLLAPRGQSPRLYDDVIAAFRARGFTLAVGGEEADGEALLTLIASGEGLSFFPESTAPIIRVAAVLKPVRDLDVVMLGRTVWRASDEADPLVRSLLDITAAVYRPLASPRRVARDRPASSVD